MDGDSQFFICVSAFKGLKCVDFELFTEQLVKARYFIDNYHFESEEDKNDAIENYNYIAELSKTI